MTAISLLNLREISEKAPPPIPKTRSTPRPHFPAACDLDHISEPHTALVCVQGTGNIAMKRSLLLIVFAALAGAVILLPVRTTPPVALADAGATEWKCSTSALVFTTCAPSRSVRLASFN
jgi:hypothetical protein